MAKTVQGTIKKSKYHFGVMTIEIDRGRAHGVRSSWYGMVPGLRGSTFEVDKVRSRSCLAAFYPNTYHGYNHKRFKDVVLGPKPFERFTREPFVARVTNYYHEGQGGGTLKVTISAGFDRGVTYGWTGELLDNNHRPIASFRLGNISGRESKALIPVSVDGMLASARRVRCIPPGYGKKDPMP